jgi:hypothetical protein
MRDCLFLGSFLKKTKLSQFLGYFFHGKSNVFILTKNGLGDILGDFATNSSGRPVSDAQSKL